MSTDSTPNAANGPDDLGTLRLLAMATATGIAVANIYYNQPLLGIIVHQFGRQGAAGLIPTATQLGYAAGLFLLVPLGDILRRRPLIIGQFIVLALALTFAASAPSALILVAASFLVGAASTVAQQIVPFAASLATPERRGAAIGAVMSGLLAGILLSRTIAGFVGAHAGWREMFWLGVPLALAAALMMAVALPGHAPASRMSYGAAIRSLATLWMREPALRVATTVQAALFGSFTVFWTILALHLQGPRFHLGADIAGLFGILGVAGILAAPLAGRMADRRGPHAMVRIGAAMALASWALFGMVGSIPALIAGVVVLDLGLQSAMIPNQHIIYALDESARNRINTVYMTGMFLGGAAGSALATVAWTTGGWPMVCLAGGLFAAVALITQTRAPRGTRRKQDDSDHAADAPIDPKRSGGRS
ncbi:MAG: MFS transporter [Paracoccaceae bacterium]